MNIQNNGNLEPRIYVASLIQPNSGTLPNVWLPGIRETIEANGFLSPSARQLCTARKQSGR